MAKDRNGNKLAVGDDVTLTPGMSVKDYRTGVMLNEGKIQHIDGEYIDVFMVDSDGKTFTVERYGVELWKGDPHDKA